ncbi:hypothetical protein [Nannocystis pusilla]|uniref:hypothetical protein n=1 Tax=Nannocystis pusilla TaxID=889268 RepID=UPI003B788205
MRRCLFFFALVSCADAAAPATGAPPAPTPGQVGTPPSATAGEATASDVTVLDDLEWKDLVTGVSASGDVFADARGVWRCEDGACQHRPWSGGDGGRQALPCDASSDDNFAVSPAGTRVAQVCEGKLAISTLTTGEVVRRKLPFPELDDLEIDESGVVTAIHEHSVARVTAKGLQGPFALEVPKDALTPTNLPRSTRRTDRGSPTPTAPTRTRSPGGRRRRRPPRSRSGAARCSTASRCGSAS